MIGPWVNLPLLCRLLKRSNLEELYWISQRLTIVYSMTCSWLRLIDSSHLTLSLRLHLLLSIMILLISHHIPLMLRIAYLSSCSYLSLLSRWIQEISSAKIIHNLHSTWAILSNWVIWVIIKVLMLILFLVSSAFLISLVHSNLKPKGILFRVLIEILRIIYRQVKA